MPIDMREIRGSYGKIRVERHQTFAHLGCVDDIHSTSAFLYPHQIDLLIDQLQAVKRSILTDYPYLKDAEPRETEGKTGE